jgi:biotin transporter BioY
VEFFSYNIFYWCMAFINHDKNYSNSGTFIGLSVLLLTVLIIYLIGRLYLNLIAGLYMVKRLLFACVLASSY